LLARTESTRHEVWGRATWRGTVAADTIANWITLIVDMPAYCTDVKFAWKTDSVAEMRDTEVCKETKEIGERNNEDRE